MGTNLGTKVQSSSPGALIELFKLDITPVNSAAPLLYFYPGSTEGVSLGVVTWLGNSFIPMPMEFTGSDVTGKGSVPRPVLTVSNLLGTVSGLIQSYGPIGGSILTRWQTFTDFLDTGSTPDSSGYLPLDVWLLDRVIKLNKQEAQFECRSYFDYQGVQLPRRQVLRDSCPLIYRVFDPVNNVFNYTNTTCPYTGSQSFDASGNVVSDPRLDNPSKSLGTCCRPRFGTAPLPFGAYPGVQQFT